MRSDTQTVVLEAHPQAVFDFLAEPQNLPRWAVGFCRAIRPDGDRWLVTTGQGDVRLRFRTDPATGVIDFHISPAPETEVVAYSRVVPHPSGAAYVFTQVQPPDMPDEVFDGQRAALREELEVLRLILRAQAACPSPV